MAKTEASITIDRVVEDVFAYAADLATWPEWNVEVEDQETLTEGPSGEGTRVRFVGKLLGRRIEVLAEVSTQEPDTRLAFKTSSGPMTGRSAYTLESIEDGTRVTGSYAGDSGGVFKLLDPLVVRMAKRHSATNLANMKDLIDARAESGTSQDGADVEA